MVEWGSVRANSLNINAIREEFPHIHSAKNPRKKSQAPEVPVMEIKTPPPSQTPEFRDWIMAGGRWIEEAEEVPANLSAPDVQQS